MNIKRENIKPVIIKIIGIIVAVIAILQLNAKDIDFTSKAFINKEEDIVMPLVNDRSSNKSKDVLSQPNLMRFNPLFSLSIYSNKTFKLIKK